MVDWKDNVIGTLLMRGSWANDRVHPQIIMARDFRAKAWAIAPQIDAALTDRLTVTFGFNVKGKSGSSDKDWAVDDCRSCNPYPPFSAFDGGHVIGQSLGLSGLEPLGRFRAGPIGAAWRENEAYLTLKYKF